MIFPVEKVAICINAVAGKNGKANAVQVIYLDPKTADKARNLDVLKRSIGIVKGSFVELTKNINNHTVFIAEGIETALSIAQTEPDACVICSLGISNMKTSN